MASFELAINKTLDNEGGAKYTNNPKDPGGATKYGISLRFYRENINKNANEDTIRNLDKNGAIGIYEAHFWNPNRYKDIKHQPIAEKIFDMGVNMGCSTSNKIAQKTFNIYNNSESTNNILKEDGVFGIMTISSFNGIKDINKYLNMLKLGYSAFYEYLVKKNPVNETFIKGWLKRANS